MEDLVFWDCFKFSKSPDWEWESLSLPKTHLSEIRAPEVVDSNYHHGAEDVGAWRVDGWEGTSRCMREQGFSRPTRPAVQPQEPTPLGFVQAFLREGLTLPQSHSLHILDPIHMQVCSRRSLVPPVSKSCSSRGTLSCPWVPCRLARWGSAAHVGEEWLNVGAWTKPHESGHLAGGRELCRLHFQF